MRYRYFQVFTMVIGDVCCFAMYNNWCGSQKNYQAAAWGDEIANPDHVSDPSIPSSLAKCVSQCTVRQFQSKVWWQILTFFIASGVVDRRLACA